MPIVANVRENFLFFPLLSRAREMHCKEEGKKWYHSTFSPGMARRSCTGHGGDSIHARYPKADDFNMVTDCLWGFDLGGTKIEGIVLAPGPGGEVLARKRIPTEGDRGYGHVLKQITGLLESMIADTGISPKSIGMGTPGTLDPHTGLLRGSNSQHLNHRPLNRDLEDRLGIPVWIENDANCLALAESESGAAAGLEPGPRVVFGMILGTGVGGGIVVDGKLLSGNHGIAGEWGHNFLDESGGPCYCGRSGCVETILSGPALERHYRSLTGNRQTLEQVSRLSESGDANAQKTITRLVRYFGKGVANVINLLDPDVIVIGGGVGKVKILYSRGIEEAAKYVFAPRLNCRIVPPELGDSAGVFGAAYLNRNGQPA
ncbi:MAG: ROK family protein [Gammaproteobacteria bacterium]|nr:ROK family protein [Gammaproteobacteria bacterium]